MPLRLALDTNVWLDWLVFDDPAITPLKAAVAAGNAEIVIDAACETELVRVLGYPLQKWTLDATRQVACLKQCRDLARMVTTQCAALLPRCADTDDQKFLELAASAQVDWLITKDLALLALARYRPALQFHIVTPAEFALRQA